MEALEFLQKWYAQQCNGDWEHQQGIQIESFDNPGWLVKVNLKGTDLENRRFDAIRESVDEAGWPQGSRVASVLDQRIRLAGCRRRNEIDSHSD